jgi:hypothetical protein
MTKRSRIAVVGGVAATAMPPGGTDGDRGSQEGKPVLCDVSR